MLTESETATEVFKRARARIERGWCQGAFAFNNIGEAVRPADPTACEWCTTGAIFVEGAPGALERNCALFKRRAWREGPHQLAAYNDAPERTKEQVLAAFDRAIENESEAG